MLRRTLLVGVAAASVLLILTGVILLYPEGPELQGPLAFAWGLYFRIALILMVAGLAIVGLLVAIRRPEHPIGWLFLVSAFLTSLSIFGGRLGVLVERGGGEPAFGTVLLLWISTWAFTPAIGILIFAVPLIFPTGRLLSSRWRVLAWISAAIWIPGTIVQAFRAGPAGSGDIDNPFGIPALTPFFGVVDGILIAAFIPALFATIASVVLRYRRARSIERQQMRWFLYPATLAAFGFGLGLINPPIGGLAEVGWTVAFGSIALVPPAIGVAILRHRLFEIDRIVGRTLTYALVTSVLIGVYLAAVLTLQFVLAPILPDSSPLIVAASTLLVAALVRPILRRVQVVVDRRFDRSRYDSEITARALAGRLRDVTDLDRVSDALTQSAVRALAPRSVSVWLRPRQAE
jgi:hypothetical protein